MAPLSPDCFLSPPSSAFPQGTCGCLMPPRHLWDKAKLQLAMRGRKILNCPCKNTIIFFPTKSRECAEGREKDLCFSPFSVIYSSHLARTVTVSKQNLLSLGKGQLSSQQSLKQIAKIGDIETGKQRQKMCPPQYTESNDQTSDIPTAASWRNISKGQGSCSYVATGQSWTFLSTGSTNHHHGKDQDGVKPRQWRGKSTDVPGAHACPYSIGKRRRRNWEHLKLIRHL